MRRRRTSRGTWFPTIGTLNDGGEDTVSGREFVVAINDPLQTVGVIPITFDVPFEGDNISPATDSLGDIIGSDYVLQRIVGKLHMVRTSTRAAVGGADENPAILVGCGFLVARANDAGSGGGLDTPIGSATSIERRDNYSPLDIDTIREPWIWRRTWILGAGPTNVTSGTQGVTNAFARGFPPSTAQYGSVADGAHIDSRVKRRIGNDNRLWFAIACVVWPLGTQIPIPVTEITVHGYLDYRIFGSLRKAKQSSAF